MATVPTPCGRRGNFRGAAQAQSARRRASQCYVESAACSGLSISAAGRPMIGWTMPPWAEADIDVAAAVGWSAICDDVASRGAAALADWSGKFDPGADPFRVPAADIPLPPIGSRRTSVPPSRSRSPAAETSARPSWEAVGGRGPWPWRPGQPADPGRTSRRLCAGWAGAAGIQRDHEPGAGPAGGRCVDRRRVASAT